MTDYMDERAIKKREEFLSIAEAYIDKNLYNEALHAAESWLKGHPVDADAHIIRCHALLRMGNIERVKDILDDVENTVLQLSRIYNRVGDLCLNGGLIQEATRFYQKFIYLNPGSPIAKNLSEKINSLLPSVAEAALERDEDTDKDSDHIMSDFRTATLAELYIKQGHLDMAAEVLRGILTKDPWNQRIANRLKDVESMLNNETASGGSLQLSQNEEVIQELTRWLENIGRLRSYAL